MNGVGESAQEDTAKVWPKRLRAAIFRDVCAFAAVLAISMACVSLFVSWQTIEFLQEQIDNHLMTDARSISADPGPMLLPRLSAAINSDPQKRRVGGVFDRTGQKLEGNLDHLPHPLPLSGSMGVIEDPRDNAPAGRGRIRVGHIALPGGQTLIFGRRVNELDQVRLILKRTLICAIIPIGPLALLGGGFIWRVRERRLRAVERTCHKIMAGDLQERLPASRRADEFHVISVTINRMLEEVERLMIELRNVGDSMAHDLRTPLTRLRTRLGRISEGDFDLATTRTALSGSISEVDQLIGIIRAVLRLGAIESGQRRSCFLPLEIGLVADAASDLFAPVAEEKGLQLTTAIERTLHLVGDRELLFEAIANLLDNAIKFTPAGGIIRLSVTRTRDGIVVAIEDDGPGIAAEERVAVLQRFYRGDPSRNLPGNGLGLSIVSAIAKLHGAAFVLTDGADGIGCRAAITLAPSETVEKFSVAALQ